MRCPLKEDNFGRMPECQPDCAWLVEITSMDSYELEEKPMLVCAETARAMGIHYYNVKPINAMGVER